MHTNNETNECTYNSLYYVNMHVENTNFTSNISEISMVIYIVDIYGDRYI